MGQGVAGAVLLLPGCPEGVGLVPLSPGRAGLKGGLWQGLCWGRQVNAGPQEVGSLASASHLPRDPAPFLGQSLVDAQDRTQGAFHDPVEEWDEEGPFQLGLRDGAGDMGRGEHPAFPSGL